MYDTEFDTDWDDLDRDTALERAFALGVARHLGEPDRAEYERVLDSAETTYRRSLLQLSYEEGRRKAAGRPDESATTVWERLVAGPEAVDPPDDPRGDDPRGDDPATGPPEMLSRPDPTVVPDDGRDLTRLPSFLRRRR